VGLEGGRLVLLAGVGGGVGGETTDEDDGPAWYTTPSYPGEGATCSKRPERRASKG
jgi:hypothetical protein